jgi:hypothetical protein
MMNFTAPASQIDASGHLVDVSPFEVPDGAPPATAESHLVARRNPFTGRVSYRAPAARRAVPRPVLALIAAASLLAGVIASHGGETSVSPPSVDATASQVDVLVPDPATH